MGSDPGVFDRLCRLACTLLGAPAAHLYVFEGDGTALLGRWGDERAEPGQLVLEGTPAPDLRPTAGIPLRDPETGEALGSLLVLGGTARLWTAGEREMLDDVAAAAASEVRWMRAERASRRAAEDRDGLLERERSARRHAEEAERRSTLLAEASALLDASLDYEATFQRLARLAVPTLADYCLIDEYVPGGGTRRIARYHVDPAKLPLLYTGMRHSPDEDLDRHPVVRVVRDGTALLIPEVTEEIVNALSHDAEHRARLEALALRSFIVAPLVARGRVLGAITLVSAESGRTYAASDVVLAEEVARRAAAAIDHARLYTQAQQALRSREAVVGVLSRDLRNPLATVLLNATMLLDLAPAGRLEPWMEDALRQVVDAVEQSNRLVEGLVDVARIESGGFRVEPVAVDGRALLAGVVHRLRPAAEARGVVLEAGNGDGAVPVLADPDRVTQALSHLIGSAIGATPEGGRVTVSVTGDHGTPRFTVADAGAGLPEEELAHLFDGFWERPEGTVRGSAGLGLPIAGGIVAAHGGRIWAESHPGAGTAFHFTLPAPPSSR